MYSVQWVRSALNDLTEFWIDASPLDRKLITAAANEIDRLLRLDPENQGESRTEDRRVLLVAPLGVTFKVFPDDRVVKVLDVWQFEKRTPDE